MRCLGCGCEAKNDLRRRRGRVQCSTSRAIGTWTNVFCDASLSVFPSVLSGCSQLVQTNSHDPCVTCTTLSYVVLQCSKVLQHCPDEVMRIPADRTNVEREIWSRTEKEEMDVTPGRTWTSYEWSCGAWHAREHLPKEYWQIFVDERLVPRDATDLHVNARRRQCSPMP